MNDAPSECIAINQSVGSVFPVVSPQMSASNPSTWRDTRLKGGLVVSTDGAGGFFPDKPLFMQGPIHSSGSLELD
jgi:hypothetical protein